MAGSAQGAGLEGGELWRPEGSWGGGMELRWDGAVGVKGSGVRGLTGLLGHGGGRSRAIKPQGLRGEAVGV